MVKVSKTAVKSPKTWASVVAVLGAVVAVVPQAMQNLELIVPPYVLPIVGAVATVIAAVDNSPVKGIVRKK